MSRESTHNIITFLNDGIHTTTGCIVEGNPVSDHAESIYRHGVHMLSFTDESKKFDSARREKRCKSDNIIILSFIYTVVILLVSLLRKSPWEINQQSCHEGTPFAQDPKKYGYS